MKITTMISILFLMSTHPMTMIFMMIMMTMTIAFLMYSMMKSLWFALILILLLLGGMMILFIYVVSLTPNEKFIFKKWTFFIMILPLTMKIKILNLFLLEKKNILIFNMDKNSMLLIFITIFLLLTLVAIMKLINSSLAPLRLKN
nr:NADH dehydrogenase subunit 6 [Secretargas transgariepinus]